MRFENIRNQCLENMRINSKRMELHNLTKQDSTLFSIRETLIRANIKLREFNKSPSEEKQTQADVMETIIEVLSNLTKNDTAAELKAKKQMLEILKTKVERPEKSAYCFWKSTPPSTDILKDAINIIEQMITPTPEFSYP